ncbi:lasso peptide biosynthesis B2 protein [Actinoplanes sp. NPDC051411]|uniref:lasso peptide biosynthesis B2 protein n=1 Tax=Actinoplanes sp. NPDC051411 TaxID=3155522 RepID=UPI00341DAEBF
MTLHMTVERRQRPPWRRRLLPGAAVWSSRALIAMTSPYRLEAVLRRLATGARPATYADALRARDDVVAVSLRCAGQYCLQRSVAVALLTRARGRWADWVSGVNLQPFAAHAWVEVDGRPVGEPLDLTGFQRNIVVPCRDTTGNDQRKGRNEP